MGKCSIDDCYKQTLARDLCGKHYQRWRKYNDPLFMHEKVIDLTNNRYGLLYVTGRGPKIGRAHV